MSKLGKKGRMLAGTCDRCICHSERLRTVLFFDRRLYETTCGLKNFCPGCRSYKTKSWRWPEATSQDAAIAKAIQAQEAFNR